MDIKIVPMMQDDVPQVAALEAACFSDPWSAQILSNELQNELSLWLVAKDGDTVLGYVGSQSVLDEADMMNLAVRETVRRQGIARLLVLSLCRQLHEKGVMSLTLEVRDSNEPAIRLYSSLGFLQVGRAPQLLFSSEGGCAHPQKGRSGMNILSIESSCDETAVAIVRDGRRNPNRLHRLAGGAAQALRRRGAGDCIAQAH